MKPAITRQELQTYRIEDIDARTLGREGRDVITDLLAEAAQHTENTTHWLAVYRTDGASTDQMGPHAGLSDDDRALLLKAIMAATYNTNILVAAAAGMVFVERRPGWDPLTTTP